MILIFPKQQLWTRRKYLAESNYIWDTFIKLETFLESYYKKFLLGFSLNLSLMWPWAWGPICLLAIHIYGHREKKKRAAIVNVKKKKSAAVLVCAFVRQCVIWVMRAFSVCCRTKKRVKRRKIVRESVIDNWV